MPTTLKVDRPVVIPAGAGTKERVEITNLGREALLRSEEWIRDAQEAETKLAVVTLNLKEACEFLDKLREPVDESDRCCPICDRTLKTKSRAKAMTFVTAQIEDLRADVQYFTGRVDQLASAPEIVEDGSAASFMDDDEPPM